MKILFFTYRYWPEVGGVEKYVPRLGHALQELGHEVRLLTVAHADGLRTREVHDGIEIHRFPGHRSPGRAWFHLMRKRPLFRWADVIHVSDTHVLEYFYGMAAWFFPPKPLFLTRHGMSYQCPVPELEKRRARRSLGMVDGVVHDGYFIEKWLGVKPDCVPDQGLWPEASDLLEVPEPPPDSATFVGRLVPDSGIETYIDAIALLESRYNSPIHLHVYGGGPLEASLRERVDREGLSVTFHGWRADAQQRITQTCFAFIAGRMAMQEAMARKRLVVAAYASPLKRDYVRGEPFSPYLVSGGDAESIAEQVAYYAAHADERRRLIAEGHAHARTLSWKRTAAAYLDLWSRPLSQAPALCRLGLVKRIRLAWHLRGEARAAENRTRRLERLPATAAAPAA